MTGQLPVGRFVGAAVGGVGAAVGTVGACVGGVGAAVGTVGACVGGVGAAVGTVGADVGGVGAAVGTVGADVSIEPVAWSRMGHGGGGASVGYFVGDFVGRCVWS